MVNLIEKSWYQPHWIRYVLAPLLWPLSRLFGLIARTRRKWFLANPNHAFCAPVPVIVVGNISVGGNGKTPMVLWLVEQLSNQGMKPGVISRGYGGKAAAYPLRVTEKTQAKYAGDEPVLIFQRTGVPVAVSPVRANAIKMLVDAGVNVIVSDDGLQHYNMARDIEIAVIDGTRRFGNGHYLPFGPLRELPERLSCVDIVVCNGGSPQANEESMTLVAHSAVNLLTGEIRAASELPQVIAIAGIGAPQRFFATLQRLGVTVSQEIGFADHQDFTTATLTRLANYQQSVIMTEKDAVKCQQFVKQRLLSNWWYLPVNAQFSAQSRARILHKINQIKESYGSPFA